MVEANNALRQAAQTVVLDPEGSLTIYWHHSDTPTEGIRFWSRHFRWGDEKSE